MKAVFNTAFFMPNLKIKNMLIITLNMLTRKFVNDYYKIQKTDNKNTKNYKILTI